MKTARAVTLIQCCGDDAQQLVYTELGPAFPGDAITQRYKAICQRCDKRDGEGMVVLILLGTPISIFLHAVGATDGEDWPRPAEVCTVLCESCYRHIKKLPIEQWKQEL